MASPVYLDGRRCNAGLPGPSTGAGQATRPTRGARARSRHFDPVTSEALMTDDITAARLAFRHCWELFGSRRADKLRLRDCVPGLDAAG